MQLCNASHFTTFTTPNSGFLSLHSSLVALKCLSYACLPAALPVDIFAPVGTKIVAKSLAPYTNITAPSTFSVHVGSSLRLRTNTVLYFALDNWIRLGQNSKFIEE
jgi:hypothetical protein